MFLRDSEPQKNSNVFQLVNGQTVVYLRNGTLFSNRKEWTTDKHNIDESQIHYTKFKKSDSKCIP